MKKQILLLPLFLCFLLSGCYKSTTQHRISNDGKVTSTYTVLYDLANPKQTMTEKELEVEIEEYKRDKKNAITLLEEKIDGILYTGYRVDSTEAKDLNSLAVEKKDIADYDYRTHSIEISLDYSELSNTIKKANKNESGTTLKEQGVESFIIFTLDGVVTDTNGTASSDGKTVVFDLINLEDKKIELNANLNEETSNMFMLLLAGGVLITVILIAGLVIFKNKKSQLIK